MGWAREEAGRIRAAIMGRLPYGAIVPEHEANRHFYRHAASGVLLPSVTTVTGILAKPNLAQWQISQAAEHVRQNWDRATAEMGRDLVLDEAATAGDRKRDEAGDIGTRAHDAIERWLLCQMGGDWSVDAVGCVTRKEDGKDHHVVSCVRAAESFCRELGLVPIWPELLVADPKAGYAGTLDLLALVPVPARDGEFPCPHVERWDDGEGNLRCADAGGCGAKWTYRLTLVDWKSANSIQKAEYVMQVAGYEGALAASTGLRVHSAVVVQLDKGNGSYRAAWVPKSQRVAARKTLNHCAPIWRWLESDLSKMPGKERKVLVI